MARQLRVFAVSLLLACLFALPVYADFTVNDSNTLNNIKTNIQTAVNNQVALENRLINIHSRLVAISNNLDANFSSLLTDTTNLQSQLASILSYLDAQSTIYPDNTAIYCFDDRYFYTSATNDNYPGFIRYEKTQYINFINLPSAPLYGYLEPGDYTLVFNTSGAVVKQFAFGTNGQNNENGYSQLFLDDFTDFGYVSGGSIRRFRCDFTVSNPDGLSFGICYAFLSSSSSGYASGYIFKRADATAVLNDVLSPSIDSHGQQLENGVDQMEDLENTAFGSLDTSIGSLDFSGSALGQVVSGFTFIRAVFSAVYSSSPYAFSPCSILSIR